MGTNTEPTHSGDRDRLLEPGPRFIVGVRLVTEEKVVGSSIT